MTRHQLMESMFLKPTMLDDLDYLFKDETARRLIFYHQVLFGMLVVYFLNISFKCKDQDNEEDGQILSNQQRGNTNIVRMQQKNKSIEHGE